jgi:hypothetical protein
VSDADHPLTLTHARLRAGQGDLRGACRILSAIVDRDPADDEAARFLAELDGRPSGDYREPEETQPPPPRPASAVELAGGFKRALTSAQRDLRIERLERWLQRIRRQGTPTGPRPRA